MCREGVHALCNPPVLANAAVSVIGKPLRFCCPATFTSPFAGQTQQHLTSIKIATDV